MRALGAKHGKVSAKKENDGSKACFPFRREEVGGDRQTKGRQQGRCKGFTQKA